MQKDLKKTELMEETTDFKEGGYVTAAAGEQNELSPSVVNITELSVQNANELVEIDESEFVNEIDPDLKKEVEKMKFQGVFIPADEFTILCHVDNGAAILAKKNIYKGNRSDVAIVYAHSDGSRSDEVIISNSDLLLLSRGNFGEDNNTADKADIALAKKTLRKFEERLLPFWRYGTNVSSVFIIKTICGMYSHLKEDRSALPDIYSIYSFIIKKAETNITHPCYFYMVRRQFYAFTEVDFTEIASHFGLNIKELAIMFKQANLLYTQTSTVGYQCNVKGIGNCYCVKMPKSRMGKFEVEDLSSDIQNFI